MSVFYNEEEQRAVDEKTKRRENGVPVSCRLEKVYGFFGELVDTYTVYSTPDGVEHINGLGLDLDTGQSSIAPTLAIGYAARD